MVVWVRSFVPNEKNSAWWAMSSATRAALGIPILFRRGSSDEGLGILPRDPQLGHLDEQRLVPRQEFVKRGVDEADDDREPGHLSEDSDEVLALHPTEVVQGSDVPP